MTQSFFSGLGVALITPFKKDFSIDYDALSRVIDHVLEGGCDYIVALGTTAETPTLDHNERNEVARYIKRKVQGKVPLVLGLGGNNTKALAERIKTFDLEGYSAILSVTPFYNKPTQEGLFRHFSALAKVSPLPIILYNVPSRTGVNLSADTIRRLAIDDPKFIAVKEASGSMMHAQEIINNAPDNFKLISGNDADTCDLMKMGGIGVISVLANAFPAQMKEIVSLCSNGLHNDALKCQMTVEPLIKHLFEDGNPAGVKQVLSNMGLIENVLRLPLVPVSSHVAQKLLKESSEFLSLHK